MVPIFEKRGKGRSNYLAGYMDFDGKVLIEPRFQEADWPFEGLAAFKENGKWGYLKGPDPVIAPRFDAASRFSNGRAVVWFQKKPHVIDESGEFIATARFDSIWGFAQGYSVVRVGDRYGFIDQSGHLAIPVEFDDARGFASGVAPVKRGDAWGYIDRFGKFVCDPQFEFALPFREGLARIQVNGKFGFIDQQFRIAIPPTWKEAHDFHEHRAAVVYRNRWGYIDPTGAYAVKPMYMNPDSFSEGLAGVVKRVSLEELRITAPSMQAFQDTGVPTNGYIDTAGNTVIPFQYSSGSQFFRGLAFVSTMKENCYIRRDGTVVWSSRWVEVYPDVHRFF